MTEPKAMNAVTTPPYHTKPASHSVFESWGRPVYRRRRLVLVTAHRPGRHTSAAWMTSGESAARR